MNEEVGGHPSRRFAIPSGNGPVALNIAPGKPVVVLGRNGTGKSALVHWLYAQLQEPMRYIPGARSSQIEDDHISMTPAQAQEAARNIIRTDQQATARYRPYGGGRRNARATYEITKAQTQYMLDLVEEIRREDLEAGAIQRLRGNTAPLDRLNALMEQANIQVRFVIVDGDLRAQRNRDEFSLSRMSDGERSAMIIASEVLVAEPATVFIIDEPELHLHPAIVVPLVLGLMTERPDCSFVVSTHELDLAAQSQNSTIVLVRGSEWNTGSVQRWDVDVLEDASLVPESLRVDLYGARRKLLFVEGSSNSLDQPMYALLYPEVSVRAKETCTEVIRSVVGLRACEDVHRAAAFGMVDGDGMDPVQASKYEAQMIFPVPFYSVEALYYCQEMIVAAAKRQAETFACRWEDLVDNALEAALKSVTEENKRHLAGKLSERVIRDTLLKYIPRAADIASADNQEIMVSFTSPYLSEYQRISQHVEDNNLAAIISRYPVRESRILKAIAQALRFPSCDDYERSVLSMLTAEPDLRVAMAAKLGKLTDALHS